MQTRLQRQPRLPVKVQMQYMLLRALVDDAEPEVISYCSYSHGKTHRIFPHFQSLKLRSLLLCVPSQRISWFKSTGSAKSD